MFSHDEIEAIVLGSGLVGAGCRPRIGEGRTQRRGEDHGRVADGPKP